MKCEATPAPTTSESVPVQKEDVPSATVAEQVSNRQSALIPLAMLPDGTSAIIFGLAAGRGLARRLAELGFCIGTEVQVLKSRAPGPVLIRVRDSRIALGRGTAMKILVNPINL